MRNRQQTMDSAESIVCLDLGLAHIAVGVTDAIATLGGRIGAG